VDQLVDCGRVDVALVDQSMIPCTRLAGVVRLFAWMNRPARSWKTDQVGKGPTDIDRNEDHASALLGDGLTMAMDGRD
jgi:hypothetical protein